MNCLLCGSVLPDAPGVNAGSLPCPRCGLGLKQLDAVPLVSPPVGLKPADPVMRRLDQWLSGETMPTPPESDWRRLRRWSQQHPWASRVAAVLLISAIIVPTVAVTAYFRADVALRQTSIEFDAAEKARQELSSAVSRSAAVLKAYVERCEDQQQKQRELERQYEKMKSDYDQCRQLVGGIDERVRKAVRDARLSLAEQLNHRAKDFQASMPETSFVLATESLGITQQEGVRPIPAALQQVRDTLAPTDHRAPSGREDPITVLAASRDGNWLASGDSHGTVQLWSVNSVSPLDGPKLFHGQWDRTTDLLFTSDSRWLVSVSAGSTVCLWDLKSSDPVAKRFFLQDKPGRLVSTAVSDDGRWLAAASTRPNTKDNCIRLWDLHAKEIIANPIHLPTDQGEICALALNCNGEWIASGDRDGVTRQWRVNDTSAAVSATTLPAQDTPVRALEYSPDGLWLIAEVGTDDGKGHSINAWSLKADGTAGDPLVLGDKMDSIKLSAFTIDGRYLITASDEPALHVWDLSALQERKPQTLSIGQSSKVQTIQTSSDGRWLATTSADNSVLLWSIGNDGPSGPPLTIHPTGGQVSGVAFAAKGDWIATSNDQGTIQLWNLKVDDLIRMANSKFLP